MSSKRTRVRETSVAEIPDFTEPIGKGRYNLYKTPDGGFHVAYQKDATEEEPEPEVQHVNIPGAIIRASELLANGDMTPVKAMSIFMNLTKG